MGWPDTEGLRRLIALTTASPQIPGSKKLPHKKGTHWSDEELKALAQRKKKLKHARITHVAEKLAYEYGCTAALIRMRAKEGEELLEQEKEQEKPIWLHAPSSIARKTTK
jgi:enoyl-CoA hydratase/carnithine racemase